LKFKGLPSQPDNATFVMSHSGTVESMLLLAGWGNESVESRDDLSMTALLGK